MHELRSTWVVIVEWRSAARTTWLVEHVLATWPTVRVVVVACDASFHGWPDPRLTVVPVRNLGYAGGNNVGFRTALAAGARWVVVLNSDAYPLPGSLEHLIDTVSGHDDRAACGAALVRWCPAGPVEVTAGTGFDWKTGRTSQTPVRAAGAPVQFACGAMVLFRAEALHTVGGFDANLFLYCEEIDWCERARAAGLQVTVDPGARAIHLGSRSTIRTLRAVSYFSARNRLWVLRRYAARHGVRVSKLRQALTIGHTLGSFVRRGRLFLVLPYARGVLAGMRAVPPVVDSEEVAAAQQRYEVRDRPRRVRLPSAPPRRAPMGPRRRVR